MIKDYDRNFTFHQQDPAVMHHFLQNVSGPEVNFSLALVIVAICLGSFKFSRFLKNFT